MKRNILDIMFIEKNKIVCRYNFQKVLTHPEVFFCIYTSHKIYVLKFLWIYIIWILHLRRKPVVFFILYIYVYAVCVYIYYALISEELEHYNILKVDSDRYCLYSTRACTERIMTYTKYFNCTQFRCTRLLYKCIRVT